MNIVIVLNYNDYITTNNYISVVKDYKCIDKIIIVDNCSSDNSYEILKKNESNRIDVIFNEENKGYGSGNNFGIKYAEYKYTPINIIISNPDIHVSEESMSNLIDYLNSNIDVAAVSGVMYDRNQNIISNFAWKLPSYSHILIDTFISSKILFENVFSIGTRYNKNELLDCEMKVDVIPGCFFVIKDSVMKEIQYFDDRTFLYNEENILAYKIKNNGYKQAIITNEKIIHYQGISINKSISNWKQKNKIFHDSCMVYLEYYLNISKLKQHIFSLMFHIGKYERYILLNLRDQVRKSKKIIGNIFKSVP